MLEQIYLEKLTQMLAAEKKYTSCLKKLSATALTDELRIALSPESTDQQLHAQRLLQCIAIQKGSKSGMLSGLDQYLLECGRKVASGKSRLLQKDLNILHLGQQIMLQKIQGYTSLQKMAGAMAIQQAAMLLEQCYKDEQNTYNYLLQISQNIIYPDAI